MKDLQDVLRSSSDSRKNVQFHEIIVEQKDEETIVGEIVQIDEKPRPKSGRLVQAFKPSRTFITKNRIRSGINFTSTNESRVKMDFSSTL